MLFTDYDTAKLLVEAYADAIPKSDIPILFPTIDVTNRLAIKQHIRLHVLTQLLQSHHRQYFLALSDRQFAVLLGLTPKAFTPLKPQILELLNA